MITPEVRCEKEGLIRRSFALAVMACESGDRDKQRLYQRELATWCSAFYGIDGALAMLAHEAYSVLLEFRYSGATDFQAWAVGRACSALRAAA